VTEQLSQVSPAPKSASRSPRQACLEEAEAFVQRVKSLSRGELAGLKRNAGSTLAEARGTPWFYRLLEGEGWKNQEIYFLVATLIGLNPLTLRGDFGQTMRVLRDRHSPESVERRFRILLDAEFDTVDRQPAGGEFAYRLRQLVKLAASKEVGVDWPQLLVDLCCWRAANKPVQRRWAKSFYRSSSQRPAEATEESQPA